MKPPLGTINVIFAAPGRTGSCPSRVMSMSSYSDDDPNSMPKRIKMNVPPMLSFSDVGKLGTIQPHDDALVVTLRIGGYDIKRSWLTKEVQLRLCILISTRGWV